MAETSGIVRPCLLHVLNDESRVELKLVQPHVLKDEAGFSADNVIVDPERFNRVEHGEFLRAFEGATDWAKVAPLTDKLV